jgi:hypothetical protein
VSESFSYCFPKPTILFLFKISQVRRDAQTALKILLERNLLDIDQIQQSVCPVIIQLSYNQPASYQNFALTVSFTSFHSTFTDIVPCLFAGAQARLEFE